MEYAFIIAASLAIVASVFALVMGEYIFAIAALLVIAIATYFFSHRKETKKAAEKPASEKESKLKINMPGYKKANTDKPPQESLDSLYAQSHGMWVCRHCETLNNGYTAHCVACSAEK